MQKLNFLSRQLIHYFFLEAKQLYAHQLWVPLSAQMLFSSNPYPSIEKSITAPIGAKTPTALRRRNFAIQHVNIIALIIFCLSFYVAGYAQNTPPLVEVTDVSYHAQQLQSTIQYMVKDAEQTEVEVDIKLSANDGTSYLFPIETIEGGGLVNVGENLSLTITLNEDSLSKYNLDAGELMFKITAKDNVAVDVNAMLEKVTPTLLQSYMNQIEGIRHRTADRDHYLSAQQAIESLINTGNFQNRSQTYNFDNAESKNIIGRKAGHLDEAATYIISAHYDTVDESPGADDNGSGVCGLMAALEVFKDYEFEKSILITAFDNEEDGLIGSIAFLNDGKQAYDDIQGLVNLEMIGYYSEEPNSQTLPLGFDLLFADQSTEIENNEFKGDFITNVANTASVDLMNAFSSAALTYVPGLKVISLEVPGDGSIAPDLRRSDHAPFWIEGYQALMITDGANFRNPHYHSPDDKSEHLNFNFMAQVVKTTLATVANKAGIVSIGYTEGNITTKVSVADELLTDQEGFNFAINGLGKQQFIAYTLPNHQNTAKLEIFNTSGKQIQTFPLTPKNNTAQVEVPVEGIYWFILTIEGFQPYTKKVGCF